MALSEREALRMLSFSSHDAESAANFLVATGGNVLAALQLLEEIAKQLPAGCQLAEEQQQNAVVIAMEMLAKCNGDTDGAIEQARCLGQEEATGNISTDTYRCAMCR